MPFDRALYDGVADQLKTSRRSARLRELAYQAIKDSILTGVLGPEAPLIEERLAAVLEISRTPVREALAILEHEGLIESVPYKGLFVRDVTVGDFLLKYETVEVVEPALARLAAVHAQPSDIAAMEDVLARAKACIPHDVPGYLASCREFQERMGQCAKNPYLTSMLIGIEEHADLYLLKVSVRQSLPADKMLAAVADRRAMLDAIRAGDAEAATEAARAHAHAVQSRWREFYAGNRTAVEAPHPDGRRRRR